MQKILRISITALIMVSLSQALVFAQTDSPQKNTPAPAAPAPATGGSPSTPSNSNRPSIIPKTSTVELKLPHTKDNVSNESQFLQSRLLPALTATIISITGGLSLLFVIVGGLQFLTAFGDEGKMQKGKKMIQYALIGLITGSVSYGIVAAIAAISNSFR